MKKIATLMLMMVALLGLAGCDEDITGYHNHFEQQFPLLNEPMIEVGASSATYTFRLTNVKQLHISEAMDEETQKPIKVVKNEHQSKGKTTKYAETYTTDHWMLAITRADIPSTLSVTVPDNTTGKARTVAFVLSCDGQDRKFTVTQAAK